VCLNASVVVWALVSIVEMVQAIVQSIGFVVCAFIISGGSFWWQPSEDNTFSTNKNTHQNKIGPKGFDQHMNNK